MAVYDVDEFSFEVPDGYVDRSINIFFPSTPQGGAFSIVLTRDRRTEEPFSQQVAGILKEVATKLPGVKVVAQRDRPIGSVPAREVRLHAAQDKTPTYQRQILIGHYDTILTLTVTSPRALSARCDALAERLIGGLKLRKL